MSIKQEIVAIYRGECKACEDSIQRTVKTTKAAKDPRLWVRCTDCEDVTICGLSDTRPRLD